MTTSSHVTFDQWAIDVTNWPNYSFVPICGDEVIFGMILVQDRAPGPLIAVVSEEGQNHVNQWIADHPTWYIDFGKAMSPVSI